MNRKALSIGISLLIEAAAVFAAIVLCVAILQRDGFHDVKQWGLEHNASGRNNHYCSQVGSYETGFVALIDGVEVNQGLQITKSMLKDEKLEVALYFGTFQRVNEGKLYVDLIQKDKLQQHVFDAESVQDGCPLLIEFLLAELEAGNVNIKIYAKDTTGDSCLAVYTRETRQDGLMGMDMKSEKKENPAAMFQPVMVNGIVQNGPLVMELYTCTE